MLVRARGARVRSGVLREGRRQSCEEITTLDGQSKTIDDPSVGRDERSLQGMMEVEEGMAKRSSISLSGALREGETPIPQEKAFESSSASEHHLLSADDASLTFTNEDFKGIDPSQDDPMFIMVGIDNFSIIKTLVDHGSSMDILDRKVFKRIRIGEEVMNWEELV